MSDRKYKQRGYQDSEREERRPESQRPIRENLGGPKQLNMPGRRSVVRCAGCGAILPAGADMRGQCPRCKFELHSCKQCVFFDTAARFECIKPITARIARKEARNECSFYQTRVTVERDTSSGGTRPLDARAAFEALFKK
jgi:hypothetical protein